MAGRDLGCRNKTDAMMELEAAEDLESLEHIILSCNKSLA